MANSYNATSFTSTSYTTDILVLKTAKGILDLGDVIVVDSLNMGDMIVIDSLNIGDMTIIGTANP